MVDGHVLLSHNCYTSASMDGCTNEQACVHSCVITTPKHMRIHKPGLIVSRGTLRKPAARLVHILLEMFNIYVDKLTTRNGVLEELVVFPGPFKGVLDHFLQVSKYRCNQCTPTFLCHMLIYRHACIHVWPWTGSKSTPGLVPEVLLAKLAFGDPALKVSWSLFRFNPFFHIKLHQVKVAPTFQEHLLQICPWVMGMQLSNLVNYCI